MFAVAQLIFAPFTAFIKNKIGSKNTIVAGFFLTTCTTVGLALMTLIEDPDTFFYVGNALRFVQGLGDVWVQFTAYSIITSIFSNDILRYIKYVEISVSLGLGIGPLAGDFLYE